MATAAPSSLVGSVEKTNGAKLSRLLIDGGTTILMKHFDRYHPPAQLMKNLNSHRRTLIDLWEVGHLSKPQWYKLFPSKGPNPASKDFDISLLFLLLTNICGLSPPDGEKEWNKKPKPMDHSLEANILRIKDFRNKLHGHITTTGIDTPSFNDYWRKITGALCGLGVPRNEVERLKAEHCGEEDYIDLLCKWYDSDLAIKSQLKDMCQSQTEVQQAVDKVHLTQLNSNKKLEEVCQVQSTTLQTVGEVRQSHTKTEQAVDKIRQNQLEDRGTIHNNNMKLQEVFQIDTKTHHVVTNVRETQINDSEAIQKMRDNQQKIYKIVQETKSRVEEIQQTQEKLLETQDERFDSSRQDLKQTAEDLEGQREKHRENEILKKLAKIETLKNVRYHADRYVEGTRLSIFASVESWLDDRSSANRVMVISGNAGMGKSVISAVMCDKMYDAGRLAGSHFCEHGRARHRNPRVMLQSLASQLCDFLPDYKKALVEKLSRNLGVEINSMELKDLFDVLFEEPLTSLNDPGLTFLMVIDGLDESEYQGRNELLDVIANYFQSLPLWIRFLVTTRPEKNIAENLKSLHPLQLDPKVEENLEDIHLFFEKQIGNLVQSEHRGVILEALVQNSEGVMLYAHYLVDFIKREVQFVTPELLDSILPSGISSVYHSYFKRLETELCRKELNVTEDHFLNFLSAVAAAREPLPLGFVSKLLLPGKSTSLVQRNVNAAIACVSALLPVEDECIHFFHKSVKDWLIDKSNYGQHQFSVDERGGHEVLSKLCMDELDEVKRKGVDCGQISDIAKYALQHGVKHMLQLEDARVCSIEEVVTKFVLDLELVYAKLCVNVTAPSEDIVCVQKQAGVKALQGKCQRALNTLLLVLRNHIDTLKELPHTIFQTLLNKGGDQFSSEASRLLENKYSEMAYIEYSHKEDLQGSFGVKFKCSAAVACFDISPQLDYMVCECVDGTIQLWSLRTGGLVWERDVKVKKCYVGEEPGRPYRPTVLFDSVAYYRSVVFHPTEDLVLPGILSHAYTFDGDLKPLFVSSKCRFTVCSISADKTKMLTDCPNDDKLIIMWHLTDGSEIERCTWNCQISSFAWSRDGRLLAISDCSRFITLVDAMVGFKTLAQTDLSDVCGMIKFSPDCRCLYCLYVPSDSEYDLIRLDVNRKNDGRFSLDVFSLEVSYNPWEFESCSETGFLLGDPFCWSPEIRSFQWRHALVFVLNEQFVLRVSSDFNNVIEMLNLDELTKDSGRVSEDKFFRMKVALSLDGNTLYVIAKTRKTPATVKAWDISSGKFKAERNDFEFFGAFFEFCILVPLREGILLKTYHNTLELWNCELSECIRSWTHFECIFEVIPISDERVACQAAGSKVIIVDTTQEGIVSTINLHGKFIACNSKCDVMTTRYFYDVDDDYRHGEHRLQMQCGEQVLWEISEPMSSLQFKAFSPSERYCVLAGEPFDLGYYEALYVLDVLLGKTLHRLCLSTKFFGAELDCKFVSEEECVTLTFSDEVMGGFLKLFNVKSGDLLSEIALKSPVSNLAACQPKCLIAFGLKDSKKVNVKFLQVKLPRNEDNRKSKRIKLHEIPQCSWEFPHESERLSLMFHSL